MRWLLNITLGLCGAGYCCAEEPATIPASPPTYFPADTDLGPYYESEVEELPLTVRLYPVADLVVDFAPKAGGGTTAVESSPFPTKAAAAAQSPQQKSLEHLAELSVVLQTVVAPGSWEMSGGQGRVTIHGRTFSLIVLQADDVHEEIAELLSQIRREQELEIRLQVDYYSPSSSESREAFVALLERLAEDDAPANVDEVREDLKSCGAIFLRDRVQLQNGATCESAAFQYTAVASGDRRTIRLHASHGPETGRESTRWFSFERRIRDGHTVIVPIVAEGEPLLALVTPQVRIPDEEEELLQPLNAVGAPISGGQTRPSAYYLTDDIQHFPGLPMPARADKQGLIGNDVLKPQDATQLAPEYRTPLIAPTIFAVPVSPVTPPQIGNTPPVTGTRPSTKPATVPGPGGPAP